MEKIKIAIGLAIIVASFVYILRNKSSMLDNLMKKSVILALSAESGVDRVSLRAARGARKPTCKHGSS